MSRGQEKHSSEEIERQLPPDLALLLSAIRGEFDAKVEAQYSRLMRNLLMLGVPIGAVGGFVAEMVRPGVVRSTGEAVVAFLLGL